MTFQITVHETKVGSDTKYYIKFNNSYLFIHYNIKGERSFKLRDSNLVISQDYHFFDTLDDAKWAIGILYTSLNNINEKTLSWC